MFFPMNSVFSQSIGSQIDHSVTSPISFIFAQSGDTNTEKLQMLIGQSQQPEPMELKLGVQI